VYVSAGPAVFYPCPWWSKRAAGVYVVPQVKPLYRSSKETDWVNVSTKGASVAESKLLERQAYSVREVCEALGCSRSYLNERMSDGSIPSVRIGGRRFIPAAAIAEILDFAK
jgi:excisionase family DNA binding protein